MLIRETLQRDLARRIEEIIKVDQLDESVVYEEIDEYVVTPSITDSYRRLLTAIAEAPTKPTEGVGVWVSGFFGSGKSSFAKNLGYVLEDRIVLGEPASTIFRRRVSDQAVSNLIDVIHAKFPIKVIMFDVQSDRSLGSETRSISHYMYRVLLRELDYAEDFDLAALEMSLEDDDKLDEFKAIIQERFGEPWSLRRKKAGKMNEASAVLQTMDANTYPSADSWAKGRAGTKIEATPNLIADRCYELMARRYPGHALVYIIDEVGQYIARNTDRIEDVRRVVELLGSQGRARMQSGEAVAPVWFVATSQERLDEVVAAIGDVKIQLARVQDRFPIRVDLSPTDIREIVVKRVLGKKPEFQSPIRELFEKSEGALKTHAALERTHRRQEFDPESFTDFHPYLPHLIDSLSIDIVSGIRLQPGADRTIGGATRTIIKQAYEMLVNDRTRMADEPIGTLVTLDKLYELLEASLLTETRAEVGNVDAKFADDPWCSKVIRAVALLGFVKDLPRTPRNIAALLYPRIDAPSPLPDVEQAIGKLQEAQHIRETEDGFKILTAQEKNWQIEKQKLEVKPRQRNELVDTLLQEIFSEPTLKTYKYQNRQFSVSASTSAGSDAKGISVLVVRAESPDKLADDVEAARKQSRTEQRVFWVFPLTSELDALVADLVRSREMVRQYETLRSQNKISIEASASLDEEKRHVIDAEVRLRAKLTAALGSGQMLFDGRSKDVSALGQSAGDGLRKFLDEVVPALYPNLGDGAASPKASDADDILKAANLDALPAVYGHGELGLFVKSDGTTKYDPDAPIARTIHGYLKEQVDYGEKPTGRSLEEHFSSSPYGWEADVIRVALAGMYRGGSIRITTKGRTHEDYTDQQSWPALTKLIDFRNASFAPQKQVEVGDLVKARAAYVDLTGQDVDVDAQKISRALGEFVRAELAELPGLIASARARQLPIADTLEQYEQELAAIEREDVQVRVTRLAQEAAVLKKQRDEAARIRAGMTEANLTRITRGRAVLDVVAPALQRAGAAEDVRPAEAELRELLGSPSVLEQVQALTARAESIQNAYVNIVNNAHQRRNEVVRAAAERIESDERLIQLNEADRTTLLRPLTTRLCDAFSVELGSVACDSCRGTIEQMESDTAAAGQLEADARRRVIELTTPEQRTQVVKASSYFGKVANEDDIAESLEALKSDLMKYLSEGVIVIVE